MTLGRPVARILFGIIVLLGTGWYLQPAPRAQETAAAVQPILVSADTGEKPQSKLWYHASTWWAVLPSSSPAGTWVWRLNADNSWTNVLQLSASTTIHADVKAVGGVAHVLLYAAGATELASIEYVSASHTYQLWSARPSNTPVALLNSETATVDVDSTGRMWLATESGTNINVYYSDSPYSVFMGPVNLAGNIADDDISVVTALPNNTIGVLWSNQSTRQFGFKVHVDGADPDTWSTDELPASQSALNIGLGMADDHMNVAVAADGTLYAAVKTSYDTAGAPKIALLVRRPHAGDTAGTWDNLYQVDVNGTRGIVLLDELRGLVRVIYTSSESGGDILYKESSTAAINFSGAAQVLISGASGALNNVTSTKQNWTGRAVVLASTATQAKGVLISRDDPNLVGLWPMNEGAGSTARDYSGFSSNGTLQGNATWAPGVSGTAVTLDGTGDFVLVPNSRNLNVTGAITLATWVKPGRQLTQDLIKKATTSGIDGYELALANSTTSKKAFVRFNQATSGDTYRLDALNDYPFDGTTWLHLAATYDGSNIRLYVNGVLQGEKPGPASIATNTLNVGIGGQPADGLRTLLGQLDDTRIYNRALSAAEIATLANVSFETDLAITKTDGRSSVTAGQPVSYSIVASNNGPIAVTGATVTDSLPAALTGISWTCAASSGSSCPASGSGNINAQVNLAVNGSATFTVAATVSAAATGTLVNTATVAPPSGVSDPVPANNSATDTDSVVASGPGINTSLVGYWKMEEGGGSSLVDASGSGNGAAITGSPLWVTGKNGLALSLNGSTYATAPHSASLNVTGPLTMSAWVKPTGIGTQNLVKKATGTAASTGGYELSLSAAGKAFVRLADASAVYRVDSATSYAGGTWIHVAATYDGTTVRMYVNGVQDGTPVAGPAAIRSNTTAALGIGVEPGGTTNRLTGLLDDVRIYNRALSASEISGLATNAAPVIGAGIDQTITLPAAASLAGTASDDGLPNPPGAISFSWTKVSGPGTVAFGNAASASTSATFSVAGDYVLRLTGDDGMLNGSDDIAVTVNPGGAVNAPPVVSAGPDQIIALPSGATLAGSATDDGLPTGGLTTTWSNVSGPAAAAFADASSATTTAAFPVAGTYVLRLSAADGSLTSLDETTITVSDPILIGAGDITPDCTAGISIANAQATAAIIGAIPGTVFTLGDNAYQDGTTQQFTDCYGAAWGPLKSRTRPATGNHEYNANASKGAGNNANPYFDYFNGSGSFTGPAGDRDKGYYSYNTGNWHVVVLNSECGSGGLWNVNGCAVGSAQEQWLRADLAASPTNNIIATWHKPRFSSSASDASIAAVQPLWQALYEYGADIVLGGHWHNYERLAPTDANGQADNTYGLRQFVVGTGGVPMSGFGTTRGTSEVRQNTDHGVLKLTLHDNSYDWQFIPIAGKTFTDAGTAAVHGAPPAPAITSITPSAGPAGGGTVVTITGTRFGTLTPPVVRFGAVAATSASCSSATTCTATSPAGTGIVDVTVMFGGQTSALTAADRFTYNQPPVVDAGTDQAITLPAGASLAAVVTDDGAPNPPGSVSLTWSMVSGPGTVTFGSPNAAATSATFSIAGTYVLRLTANDGLASGSDDVTITANPGNLAPVVDAGANQVIAFPATASLAATATDDGKPNPPGSLSFVWSKSSGPGTVAFADANALATTATFSLPGTYVLQMAAFDGALTSVDTVTVAVGGLVGYWAMDEGSGTALLDGSGLNNNGSLAGAPMWSPAIRGQGLSLNGTTQNGLVPHSASLSPSAAMTAAIWIRPAKATVATQDLIKKAINGATNGYELSLASTGKPFFRLNQFTSGDTYRANALTSYPLSSSGWQHLAATYDGSTINLYVNGVLEASVPGPASIATNTLGVGIGAQSDSTRRFEGAMDDARLYDRALTAAEIRLLANRPPSVNAGTDQTINLAATASLSGAVSDDGVPSATLTTAWTQISGPGVTTFGNAAAASTTATFSAPGVYVLSLGATDGDLSSSDLVSVTVEVTVNQPPAVNAGADRIITFPGSVSLSGTVTDDGLPGGDLTTTWSKDSGPGTVGFSDATSTATTASFSAAGTYVLRLTADDGLLTASDTATVTVNNGSGANTAIDLAGTNAYVTFGSATNTLGASAFTLELWFKKEGMGASVSTGTGGLTAVPLVTKGRGEGDNSNLDMNYFLGIDSTGRLAADFEEGATGATPGLNHPITGVTTLTDGTWYHAAATYDGSTWRLYLNGVLDAQLAVGQPVRADSIQHAAIGSALTSTGAAAGFFNGVVDEVRIWNSARSQQDIQNNMNGELVAAGGLLARWGLNEGSGSAVSSSATIVNGTVMGTYSWVAGAPFRINLAPGQPTVNAPLNGATAVGTSPTLNVGVSDPDGDPLAVTFFGRQLPAGAAPEFTLVAIPDTQHYVDDAGRAATFTAQTQWIVDNKVPKNIAFVTHLGDIVEHIDAQPVEWTRADSSLSLLESAGFKWGLAPGNHDLNSSGVGAYFDATFPVSRFEAFPWYGGYLGKDVVNDPVNRQNKNNYELFSVGGLDFIIIHLEYDMPGYSVAWANRILAQFPNRRAIVSTHLFLNASGTRPTTVLNRADGTPAETVWQQLIRTNCNVFLVLNGHYPGEANRTDLNSCGFPVHQLASDYQSRTNGGDGWLRYMTFKPAENKVYVYTFSPTLNGGAGLFETDANSQFVLDYSMQASPFTQVAASAGVASGSSATAAWPGLAPATEYEWYVTANDGAATTTSPVWRFTTTASNSAPVLAPIGNRAVAENSLLSLTVNATDPDGDVLTYGATGLPVGANFDAGTRTFSWTPDYDQAGSHQVTFTVSDGVLSANETITITVASTNRAPIVTNPGGQSTAEGQAASLQIAASDPDGTALTYSATGLPTGLTISSTGLIGGVVEFGAAASNSVVVTVNDGTASAQTSFTWTVTRGNRAPVANAQSVTTPEETPKTITLTATDADNDALTFALVTGPAHGTLSGTGADLTYSPAANYSGADSFTFRANDGTVDSPVATVSITVTPTPDGPVLTNPGNQTAAEGAVVSLQIGASDPDGEALTYSASNLPQALTINPTTGLISGTVSFTSAASYDVAVTVTDPTARVATVSFTWTVTSVNRAPVASPSTFSTPRNRAISGVLTASDPDGDAIGYAIVAQPRKGSVLLTDAATGAFTYTPDGQPTGTDSFSFKVNDGTVDSNTATVTIKFTTAVANTAPVAVNGTLAATEDTVASGTLSATDADGGALTYQIVTNGTKGTVSVTNAVTGAITYTPAANQNGTDSFTFRANDGTADSNLATVTVSIGAVNDAPVANPDAASTSGGASVIIAVLANDTDVDGTALQVQEVTQGSNGTATKNADGTVTFAPSVASGTGTFTYVATDGVLPSNAATVTVTIRGANQAPVASAQTVNTTEDTGVSVTLSGVDADLDPLAFSVVSPPAHGTLTGTGPNVTYVPSPNYNGPDAFSFIVNDGTVSSAPATVTVNVSPVNDVPIAIDGSVSATRTQPGQGTLTASDADGNDILTFEIVTQGRKGTATIDPATGAYTFAVASGARGNDSFTFRVRDAAGAISNTAKITVTIR